MPTNVFEWRPPSPRAKEERWPEDVVLAGAVMPYRQCLGIDYRIVQRPDRHNRQSPEVDAIAVAQDAPSIAFEHTRLETFAGQLEDDRKVQMLLGSFQHDLAATLPLGLDCSIPVYAFVKGIDWPSVRDRIGRFLQELVPRLRTGSTTYEVQGVPFPIVVTYRPDLRFRFRFWRIAPPRSTISDDLLFSMQKALTHKRERLREYAAAGFRTALIVDSADMSLTSWVEPYQAFLLASRDGAADHVTDVLFAWTDDPYRIYWFGFKGPPEFLDTLNPPNLKLGQHRLAAWQETLAE